MEFGFRCTQRKLRAFEAKFKQTSCDQGVFPVFVFGRQELVNMCEFLSIGLFMSHYWYNLIMIMTCTQTDKMNVYRNKHTFITSSLNVQLL